MKIFKKKKSSSPPTNSPSSPSVSSPSPSQKYPTNEKFANSKVFAKKLPPNPSDLPPFVLKAMSYLEEYGLKIEGIFRISAKKSDEDEVIQQLERDIRYDVPYENYEIHLASSLLKLYLRELMDPLLTYEQYGMFLAAERIPDEEQRLVMIQKVIKFLPPTNFAILQKLCNFLKRVAANSSVNKMSPSNLAIVFAPNLLKSDLPQSHMEILQDSKYSSNLMTTLIAESHSIFGDDSNDAGAASQPVTNNVPTTATTTSSSPVSNNSSQVSNNSQTTTTTSGHLRPLPTPTTSPHLAFNQPPVMFNPYEMKSSPSLPSTTTTSTANSKTAVTSKPMFSEPPLMEIMDPGIYSRPPPQLPSLQLPPQPPQKQTISSPPPPLPVVVIQHTPVVDEEEEEDAEEDHNNNEEMQQQANNNEDSGNGAAAAARKIKIPVRKRAIVRGDVRRPLPNPNAPRYQSTVGNRLSANIGRSGGGAGGYESDDACVVDEE